MKPLVLGRDALEDLGRAGRWYADIDPTLATRFDAAVEACLRQIEIRPQSFVRVGRRGLQRAMLRSFPYLVYFREEAATIDVVAVMHARQDVTPILRQRSGDDGT